jgi:hypothetical protein
VSERNFGGSPKSDRKSGNLKIWECRRKSGLESGPEWRGLRRHGGWDAEVEIGPVAADLAARRGEPVYDVAVFDEVRFGIKTGPKVRWVLQERAYTSLIWYNP